MLKKLLFTSAIILITTLAAYSQGTLQGKIIDKTTKDVIPFANIIIESGGRQVSGATSDFDGNYKITPIPPGKYDVKSTYVGYKNILVKDVIIYDNKITFLDIEMESTNITLETFEVVDYKVPLIDKDQTSSGATMTSEEISKMPGRSASSVASTVGGVFQGAGGELNIRGQRGSGTATYIDGVRVRGSQSLPQSAIEQVNVITGGTPARFGDVTGGVVNITTRGPSRNFGAGVELVSSQLTDKYGYNLLGFNVMGPLLKGKDSTKSTSLLGFFIAGELSYIKDPRPSSIGYYKVKDDVLTEIEQNPYRPTGLGFGAYPNSLYVRNSDVENINSLENADRYGINLSGKIDVRTTGNTNLTFGANYNYAKGRDWSFTNTMFNSKNNGEFVNRTLRLYGRFVQRFPTDKDSKSLVKNVYYDVQADYTESHYIRQSSDFQDNLFQYGYLGKFKTHKIKTYELGADTATGYSDIYIHNGWADTLVEFTASDINPDLAAYTQSYYDLYDLYSGFYTNKTLIRSGNGLLNGQLPNSVYGLWTSAGTPYNSYSLSDATQFSISANGSADIGKHELKFGVYYEQRSDRAVGYSPAGLWTLMTQLANKHIIERDLANPQLIFDANGVFQDTIEYNRLYDGLSQAFFDVNVRKKLGLEVEGLDWVDIDNLDPDFFSIDMFSADELLNSGNPYVSYYGYDHTGEKLSSKPSLDDFFNKRDENGNYTRTIGAYEPIYMAGYVQDKFAFRDLIFNIGLRIDRFDANQSVLKDPYLFNEAKTVQEVNASSEFGTDHPSNMGDDYIVYVDDLDNPSSINGYRNGDVWYNAEGIEVSDPALIEGVKGIQPYLVDPNNTELTSSAFKDYEPQITYMPRVAFSFPISEEALFFAHYDVLTKRPSDGFRLNLVSYYFIENAGTSLISNPNLKPERTVDYELGFQQKVSNTSSLKFSAYYREIRDLIQSYRFSGAYPVSYYSYNNLDFATVKGITIAYDLRRTGNVWIKANYSLQFANGTGSSSTTSAALIASGQPNLRTLIPLSFDQRHQVKTVVDFRYADGKKYNGPKIRRKVKGENKVKTIALLENTGMNVTFLGGSGLPYTRYRNAYSALLGGGAQQVNGQINGSTRPWTFTIDMRIDRDIPLVFGKKGEEGKRFANLNVYFQILNVLNSKNVVGVYGYTGNPDDDGYLNASEFQTQIESNNDPIAFRDLYSLRADSPFNYSLPRRIRFGVALSF